MAAQPQLAEAMGRAALAMPAIEEYCEFLPGVPFSSELLDDMLEDIKQESCMWVFDHKEMQIRVLLMQISTTIGRGANKYEKKELQAQVTVFHVDDHKIDMPHYMISRLQRCTKYHEATRGGLKNCLLEMMALVNKIKLRGLCDRCLVSEPRRKRLRLQSASLCTECALRAATA